MRIRRPVAALAVAGALVATTPAAEPAAELDEAIQTMLSARGSDEELDRAIAEARKLGASEQSVVEARFLYHVDRREDDKLAAMLPDMLRQSERFKLEDSGIFAVEEDWLAVLEYVKSIAALRKGDREGFKKHITEAFWLSPRQGAAFAPHIERVRLAEAMKDVRVDAALELRDLNGSAVTLAKLRGESKAVLLHFFSPWSRECEESIGDLRAVAAELAGHKIPVVGIVGEGGDEMVADTVELLGGLDEPAPGAWLVDHPKTPLGRLLRIQSAPTMVLVANDGRVLFNGHPADEALWTALAKIAPGCRRPAVDGPDH